MRSPSEARRRITFPMVIRSAAAAGRKRSPNPPPPSHSPFTRRQGVRVFRLTSFAGCCAQDFYSAGLALCFLLSSIDPYRNGLLLNNNV
jgi:hypothetical protein